MLLQRGHSHNIAQVVAGARRDTCSVTLHAESTGMLGADLGVVSAYYSNVHSRDVSKPVGSPMRQTTLKLVLCCCSVEHVINSETEDIVKRVQEITGTILNAKTWLESSLFVCACLSRLVLFKLASHLA